MSRRVETHALLVLCLSLASGLGCERSSEDSSESSPKARAPRPQSSRDDSPRASEGEDERQMLDDWRKARAVARDESRALVPRIEALNTFIERHSEGAARSKRTKARQLRTVLEARRHMKSSIISIQDKLDEMRRRETLRTIFTSGRLTRILEAVIAERVRRDARWGEPDDDIEPLDIQTPVGRTITITSESHFGLNALRNYTVELAQQAVPEMLEGTESATGRYRDVQNAKLNAILEDRLGGNLFDLEKSGHLNPAPLRTLLDRVERHLDTSLLGVQPTDLAPLIGDRLCEYALVHELFVHEVGRARVSADYEKARQERSDLLPFYRSYTEETFRTGEDPLEARYSLLSRYGVYVSVGFWMRRMADGTEREIYDTLAKVIRRVDPTCHDQLEEIGP